jgi:CheY-like chemotaxis protein
MSEQIVVAIDRAKPLSAALVDANQLENAILNLAINARDAMPDGGQLGITTDNITLDGRSANSLDVAAGDYVVVSVSDTGEGMAADIVERACEPFFTTKPAGKGSGLGLSMVFGFAQQSGGQLRILSRPGVGTSVSIYLPRSGAAVAASAAMSAAVGPVAGRGGGERILLVEDEELVREHTLNCLQQLGYAVTACADGPAALARLEDGCFYDLLLTDVKLSGSMSGREVAERARQRCAHLKVLYVSGYTDEAFSVSGGVAPGVCLLCKPFRIDELARKLREMLDH